MADACRRVLANPADAQGNLCKSLGDVIIALQTPAAAVLWSTDAAYDVICPTLGIAHLGGATLDNEENYLIKKLFTGLGVVQVENQARI